MTELEELRASIHSFGPDAARRKGELLAALAAQPKLPRRTEAELGALLRFVVAWPDDRAVLAAAHALAARLPAAAFSYPLGYRVARRLHELAPDAVELDWAELDADALQELCTLLVLPGETQGLDDITLTLEDWFRQCRPAGRNDLGFVIELLDRSTLPEEVKVHLFEQADLPIRFELPELLPLDGCEPRRIAFQTAALVRTKGGLAAGIRRPLGAVRAGGRAELDLALKSLAARRLEIYPLSYADPRDVARVDAGRGVEVVLSGVAPRFRGPLDALFFFLVRKNGVPVAYGPASACAGCCELGINLFPEFRGGEIRPLYAAVMRTLHHRLGIDCFFLTRYGMGENNPDAIRSGAFWFYRKLGFRPTNAAVETLARAEEARMATTPGHRSDRAMLHRLSHTEALLDLSDGKCRPLDFGRLGVVESRFVAERFAGDRARATSACARLVARRTGVSARNEPLRRLAVLLCAIPDFDRWTAAERRALGRIFVAKSARSEAAAAIAIKRHARLLAALRAL